MIKIVVIHFQPIEYYPPVLNLVRTIGAKIDEVNIDVLTTEPDRLNSFFEADKSVIHRLTKFDGVQRKWARKWRIIKFYFSCFFKLTSINPHKIVAYETNSILPGLLFKIIKRNVSLYLHLHEYTDKKQLQVNETLLMRVMDFIEKNFISHFDWVSHTNEDRLKFYLSDNPTLEKDKCHVIPNLPPKSWSFSPQLKNVDPIKLVYVGSLSKRNMYFEEVCTWIISQNGALTLDIYAVNLHIGVLNYLDELDSDLIQIKPPVQYYDLPNILVRYDVGLILYNGASLNYIYNAPNKLFEYWACGLDVWFSNDLISSKKYITTNSYPKVIEVDFKSLDQFDWREAVNKRKLPYKPSAYCCEEALGPLIESIKRVE